MDLLIKNVDYPVEPSENKICGNCVHNTYDNGDFLCNNKNSDNYGCYVAYDDSCEDWEEKC